MRYRVTGRWDKKQKTIFFRFLSYLTYWLTHAYQLHFVTLTSSPSSEPSKLVAHFRMLLRRVATVHGFAGVEYVGVTTAEGHGVIHVVWAWRGDRQFFVPQPWLSATWRDLHAAFIVSIENVKASDPQRLASYCVSQYCAGQRALLACFSSRRPFSCSLVRLWSFVKRELRGVERERLFEAWRRLIQGESVRLPGREARW